MRGGSSLSEKDLANAFNPNASWHADYRDSCLISVRGLDHSVTEGDLVIIFSQFGEIKELQIERNPENGRSKGFAWITYENQLSTVLAIDNMNGATLPHTARPIRVDHLRKRK